MLPAADLLDWSVNHGNSALDPAAPKIAEATMRADIKKAPAGVTQGALVSMAVHDGAVLAIVGGVGDYWKNQFNRATRVHTNSTSSVKSSQRQSQDRISVLI